MSCCIYLAHHELENEFTITIIIIIIIMIKCSNSYLHVCLSVCALACFVMHPAVCKYWWPEAYAIVDTLTAKTGPHMKTTSLRSSPRTRVRCSSKNLL